MKKIGDVVELSFEETLELLRKEAGEALAKVHEHLAKCPHTKLEEKSYYFGGSYYDKAYTDHWDQCVICNKRFNERTETHSWYG